MKKIDWLNFEDAKKYAIGLNLMNKREWQARSKKLLKPHNIPYNPNKIYPEWRGWGDFLGTNNNPGAKRIYFVNNSFFKKWSPDMAYILGFWITDGHICHNNFSITQHKDKVYLLKKIQEAMQSTYLIKKSSGNVMRITIRSREIVDDIKRLGGTERKSKTIVFPSVPKKYLPDFIRGCWDGDGCIFYSSKDRSFESHYVTASRRFVYGFMENLKKCIPNIHGKISTRKTKNNTKVYYINFYKNSTILLGKFMYVKKEEIRINKKHKLFMMAISNSQPS